MSMKDRWVSTRAIALVAIVAAWALAPLPAQARNAKSRGRSSEPPHVTAPDTSTATRVISVTNDASAAGELRLRRAAAEQRLGNTRGVIECLESLDFTAGPTFTGADRAAFLLGNAYLATGSRKRFEQLAHTVAAWKRTGPWTQWLAYQFSLLEAESNAGGALATLADPAIGSAALGSLAHFRDASADSGAAQRELASLAQLDTTTVLGRDLAGAAWVRLATRALQQGNDPLPLLNHVPMASRWEPRAQHLRGLVALERGDTTTGKVILTGLLAGSMNYPGQREVLMELAGQAMDAGQWAAARDHYGRAEADWQAEGDTLRGFIDELNYAPVWNAWNSGAGSSDALQLDASAVEAWTSRLTAAATILDATPDSAVPPLEALAPGEGPRWQVPPPNAGEWSALAGSRAKVDEARDALERADGAVAGLRRDVSLHTHYLEHGYGKVHDETAQLETRAAHLDSLRAALDRVDANLKSLRDASIHHIVSRVSGLLARGADQLRWMQAMRHFNIDGPTPLRPLAVPAGYPSPDSLLAHEQTLLDAVSTAAEQLAAQAPGLIAHSYDKAWRPGIIDRARAQAALAHDALAWAHRLEASIDSSLALAMPDSLHRLEARAAVCARAADSLSLADAMLRQSVAHDAVARARVTLEGESEGLDYGLASSAYGISVGLDRSVPLAAADSLDTGSETPEARQWRETATAEFRGFLERHPQSSVRGEMRFRLADLAMATAREHFREQMAHFVRNQATPGAAHLALPTLDAAEPLALYRSILAEDRDFAHLDAAMFNAAMILADNADPAATPMFAQLVEQYPLSRYAQESYARMGDVAFNDHRYAECIPFYEHAADGADTTLRAIALYKLGWSRFSLDRFMGAADAFRSILDLCAAGGHVDTRVDLAGEAEAYLVHTLARAGGAKAFAQYFDSLGTRPYETRLLRSLAQHFRRYSLYAEAADADRLLISRHPLEPDALLSAQRVIETYQRWDRQALARSSRLEYAPKFAPGSEWATAQSSDSLRDEGSRFSREAYTDVARQTHHDARLTGAPEDYEQALQLYETVVSTWPKDALQPALELQAGECSAQLQFYARALDHYAAAARLGVDSIAAVALLQRVAVTDTWYQTTPGSPGGSPNPVNDKLARAVIEAADQLLARFPEHERAADLMWRQGNLAFGHAWYERAAGDFGHLAERRPNDRHAPAAASLRADALFRLERFNDAGGAYQLALAVAQHAGADSLARRAQAAIPVCYYREAEAAVAQDSTNYGRHGAMFEKVAAGWPSFEHADLARYRAGLAYAKAGSSREGIRLMHALIADFPHSEFVRDAHLEIATLSEAQGDRKGAAAAYAQFAQHFPADAQAGAALLKGADLFAQSNHIDSADTLRFEYMRRHPEDVETAMSLLEDMARRELATLNADRPISGLLPLAAAAPKPAKRGARSAKAAAPAQPAAARSRLGQYMALADAHPTLASHALIAQVRFLQGDEAYAPYAACALRQPLVKSIPARQQLLDATLLRYRQCVDLGDSEWAHASTYRIGQALVAFGEALVSSERPSDLKGEDLTAYNDVIANQSRMFFTKGEDVWAELLRQKQATAANETWIQQAQTSLWTRMADRFHYRTEADVPLLSGEEDGK